jgi:TRAP-type mannitol/chloroaromatic compound transport system permease large subunit
VLSLVIFGLFFALALAGVPLMFALLATTVGVIFAYSMQHPLETILLSFIGGVEPFILIAVPLFVFAGERWRKAAWVSELSNSPVCFSAGCRAVWAWSRWCRVYCLAAFRARQLPIPQRLARSSFLL